MRQKLFTKQVDDMLFKQYQFGNDLSKQKVVAKIFNPYGKGTWYLLNSDPNDPDYIWAIVDLFEVEVGSVSREDLQTIKVPPFGLNLERDMYFQPINAQELLSRLRQGEMFEHGGMTKKEWIAIFKKDNFQKVISAHGNNKEEAIRDAMMSRASNGITSDWELIDIYVVKYADGGVVKWQDVEVGDSARVKSENKMGVIFSTYGRKFNLKFADDSMKTYDANELEFYKDEYADGGMMGVSGEMDGQWIANTGAGMFAKGGATDVELVENEGEAYLTSTGDSKKRMAVKLADGGIIENYRQRLENMSDSELAEEYEYETGVSKDDIMADIDDERDTYIDELVFRLKQTMRSRGEYADGGVMAKGGGIGKKSDRTETQKNNFGISYKLGDKFQLNRNLSSIPSIEVSIVEIMPSGLFFKVSKSNNLFSIKTLQSKGASYTSGEYLVQIKNTKYADGGMTKKKTTFADKVKSIKATLLKRKKVSPKVQKDYGKTYSPKEAEESAKRIAGSIRKKEMSKKKG